MKITKEIIRDGRKYRFAAVETGEKPREIREALGWELEYTATFRKTDPFGFANCDMNDWKHWFDESNIEIDMNGVIAVIELYETPNNS